MQAIKEQFLLDRHNNKVVINLVDDMTQTSTPLEITLSWALFRILHSYMPSPHSLTLTTGEIRSLNKLLNILENSDNNIKIDDMISFEDEDFNILKKVTLALITTATLQPILMSAPQIEDILANTVYTENMNKEVSKEEE